MIKYEQILGSNHELSSAHWHKSGTAFFICLVTQSELGELENNTFYLPAKASEDC